MQCLQDLIRAIIHIQQFINKRNVRYEPFGPWPHFPASIFGQDSAVQDTAEDTGSSSSSSSSAEDEDEDEAEDVVVSDA